MLLKARQRSIRCFRKLLCRYESEDHNETELDHQRVVPCWISLINFVVNVIKRNTYIINDQTLSLKWLQLRTTTKLLTRGISDP